MSTSSLTAGVTVAIKGKRFILLRQVAPELWQLEDISTRRVIEHETQALQAMYAAGELVFSELEPQRRATTPAFSTLTEEQLETAKVRRMYALAILHLPNSSAQVIPAIQQVWEKIRQPETIPHWTTVYRWKCRLTQAGKDFTALAPHHDAKGNRNSRFPEEVVELANEAIDRVYLNRTPGTLQDTLDSLLAAIDHENRLRPLAMQLPRPTRRMLKSLIDAIPAFEKYAARHGKTAAAKHFRSVQQHRTTSAPLERGEIDHTPLDMIVLDDENGLPLGRPYLTVLIDDYTRCILGIYISFEPPSYLTVGRCLKHAFQPKTDLRTRYPMIANAWEAHGVLMEIVVDNGPEFHCVSLENACYSLGMELHYSARRTPWFKGKIERFQGTLNRALAHGAPGSTFSNIFDKEDYDPSKFAVVRYSTLKEIIHTWIADVYHQKKHRSLGTSPAIMWERSIRSDEIRLPEDPARLDFILGHTEERVLTHAGIELYGLKYNSPELTALRRKLGSRLPVELRVDKSDLGHIFVLSPDRKETYKVKCLDFQYANGLSYWQHNVCKRFASREHRDDTASGWLAAKARIRALIEDEFMHKKQRTRTKIARFKNFDTPQPESKPPSPTRSELPLVSAPEPTPAPQPSPPLTLEDIQPAAPRVRRLKPLITERLKGMTNHE